MGIKFLSKSVLLATLTLVCTLGTHAQLPTPESKKIDEFKAVLTQHLWRYQHPARPNAPLRFQMEGKCESIAFKGHWTVKGGRAIEINKDGDHQKARLLFTEDMTSFEASWFDGSVVKGRSDGELSKIDAASLNSYFKK